MSSILSAPYFHNEEMAYAFIEARLWPNGPVCPHCGCFKRVRKMKGKSTRIGVYKCYDCRKPLTVKVGTIFEASHIPMRLWLQAIFLIASSKKGISSNQLHRTLGITLKSAWFMSHRVREAMRSGNLSPFGADGGLVEVDETYMGPKTRGQGKGGHLGKKHKVLALVDRTTKQVRSVVVDNVTVANVKPIMQENIAREAKLMTDQSQLYKGIGKEFAEHHTVNHSVGEYVRRGNKEIHTNTVENYFSVFKRGMKGTYQHCGHNHLNRYLAEFDFRYNTRKALKVTDNERAERLLQGVVGKRLTYQTVSK
jgi:transposase-like protein